MILQRTLRLTAVAIAALMPWPRPAQGTEIAGKVVLSGKATADVVVSVEGFTLTTPPSAGVFVIDHHDLKFSPRVLVIPAGATVQFKNSDGMPCRVYSVSPAGIFVLSRQNAMPMSVTFDRPGVIEVRCADHPHIHAYLVVKENPYFGVTDARGSYRIANVAPGRYTLQVWYEGATIKRKTIVVRGGNLTVNFRASRPQGSDQIRKIPDPAFLDSAESVRGSNLPLVFSNLSRSQQ